MPSTETAVVVIRPSRIAELRQHGADLFRAHFLEITLNKERRTLDPDWVQYEGLEQAGRVLSLGAWHGDKLVGYSVSLLIPAHIHYKGLCYAQNTALFVAEPYRGLSVFSRLRSETKARAREFGAQEVAWHCKQNTALHAILDKSPGCVVQDIIYTEVI